MPGAITVATNMAGRGTDIQLGGNVEMRVAQECVGLEGDALNAKEAEIRAEVARFKEQAIAAGGLYIIGTERHESRRIDNQLRGRSGRQGDPGRSKFYLSLQDDLMRIFGSERMDSMLVKLGLQEGEAIVHPWINKALEKAQQKVEARNFDMRKNVLKFDNVMNDQRKVIFERRREIMSDESVEDHVADMREEVVDKMVALHIRPQRLRRGVGCRGSRRGGEGKAQYRAADRRLGGRGRHRRRGDPRTPARRRERGLRRQGREKHARADAHDREAVRASGARFSVARPSDRARPSAAGHRLARPGAARSVERIQVRGAGAVQDADGALGRARDAAADARRRLLRGAALRADGTAADADVASGAGGAWRRHGRSGDPRRSQRPPRRGGLFGRADGRRGASRAARPANPATWGKVGRNESCPCGSGKKYKHCHGALV